MNLFTMDLSRYLFTAICGENNEWENRTKSVLMRHSKAGWLNKASLQVGVLQVEYSPIA